MSYAAQTRLETERLVLRLPQAIDLPVYTAYCASARSHFVGGPFDAHRAFEKLASMSGHWTLRGYGRYVIERDGVMPLTPGSQRVREEEMIEIVFRYVFRAISWFAILFFAYSALRVTFDRAEPLSQRVGGAAFFIFIVIVTSLMVWGKTRQGWKQRDE